MPLTVQRLEDPSEIDALAPRWARLVDGRGVQADLYDAPWWLRAWRETADPELTRRLRVLAATEGDELVAALPLAERESGAWTIAGQGFRPRYRALAAVERAGEERVRAAFGELAESLARSGARRIELPVMPRRDPATELLSGALEEAGFQVSRREGTEDCLATVDPEGWAAHRKRFKKMDRTVKNFSNKAARLGELRMESFGAPGDPPASRAFESYVALHGRGWKGAMKPRTRDHRECLLALADERGAARLYVLSVADVPAAAILWFRVGPVAIAYSTVYDARLAALSAGTIVMWRAHEALFEEKLPELVDYLPGHGPQKDQLGPERAPLVTLTAARGGRLVGLGGVVEGGARRALGAVRRALGNESEGRGARFEVPERRGTARRFDPAGDARLRVERLELDPARELFLAVAGGWTSPKKMREAWGEADSWLLVHGERPEAALRLAAAPGDPDDPDGSDEPRRVRELVLLGRDAGAPADPEADVHDARALLAEAASALGESLEVVLPDSRGERPGALEPRRAVLPWR